MNARLRSIILLGLAIGVTTVPGAMAGATRAEHKSEAVKVTFWGDWSGQGERQFDTMVKAFNRTHSDIQVDYVVQEDMLTKFLTASAAGRAPDVMFWDRWRTVLYGPKNVLEPLNSYMQRDGIKRTRFYGEAVRELTYKGKVYGLPITVDARALFYNKKHFRGANLKPPTTWAELERAAAKLTKREGGKLVRAGFSLADVGLFNMYLQQAGGTMITGDCTRTAFNSAAGRNVLGLWQRLMSKGVYEVGFEQGLGEGTDAFVTGRVSMLLTGPWNISTYRKYGKDLEFGIVPPPAGPGGKRASVMGGFGLVIPKASRNKDAAWEFVKWWTAQPKNSLLWAKTSLNIPGNKQTIGDPFFQKSPFWTPILKTLEYAKIRPTCEGYSPMEVDAVIPTLQLFLEGKTSADEALAKAQQQGDAILRKYAGGR